MATYPIDLIRDQEREMLRRQTAGMTSGNMLQQGMMAQDARTGAALANMFATQQKMVQDEDAELYRQQVMDQRQQQQQEVLQARALEAQQSREFRSLEGQKVRGAAMERLESQQRFQRAMQRRSRGVGGTRKQRGVDKIWSQWQSVLAPAERAEKSFDQRKRQLQLLEKRMRKIDPEQADLMKENIPKLESRGAPHPVVERRERAGQRAQAMATRYQTTEARRRAALAQRELDDQRRAQAARIKALKTDVVADRKLLEAEREYDTAWSNIQPGAAPIVRTQEPAAPQAQVGAVRLISPALRQRLVSKGKRDGDEFQIAGSAAVYKWEGDNARRIE